MGILLDFHVLAKCKEPAAREPPGYVDKVRG
jgi:hypothetical protein